MLNSIKNIKLYSAELKSMIPDKGGMVTNSAHVGIVRKNFYSILKYEEYKHVASQYLKIKWIDYLIDRMKILMNKMGVWDYFKKR